MIRLRLLISAVAVFIAVISFACGDDSSSGGSSAAPQQTPTPSAMPTPLGELECGAPLPEVTLESGGTTQTAVPLNAEWVGLDCTIGGQAYDFYYIPSEPLEVTADDEPILALSQQPDKLTLSTWLPDLTGSTVISSGETALPMDVTNRARLASAVELPSQVAATQQLQLSNLVPGKYVLQVLSFWPDGVATLALHVVITQ